MLAAAAMMLGVHGEAELGGVDRQEPRRLPRLRPVHALVHLHVVHPREPQRPSDLGRLPGGDALWPPGRWSWVLHQPCDAQRAADQEQ
eukprot:3107859-Pyramimonas_sp.AAC.1